MRTTLNLDDDVLEIAKTYAAAQKLSLGAAISHFIRKGTATQLRTKVVDGLHITDLPPDFPVVAIAHIQALDDHL